MLNRPFFARLLRRKFAPKDFIPNEKLFRSFKKEDLPEDTGELAGNHFKFPEYGGISCNWSRFSKPEDVRKRKKDAKLEGCYSFTVEQARFNGKASTCHDPFPELDPKNYSHMEIRQLSPKDNPYHEPPKTRRRLEKEVDGWSHGKRLAYKEHISMHLKVEFEPLA